jgi:AP2-associated kinase
MEYCPGGNLFDLLEKHEGKGIPEATVRTIGISVLQGLVVLHRAGFIHRDIKIENVLVGKDGKFKICDFGSCTKEVIDFADISKADYEHVKEKIEAFTTPMYRPPEIVDPYLRYAVSSKVDLWMLGCVLYTMSYFVHPFIDANAVGIAGAVFRFPSYPE